MNTSSKLKGLPETEDLFYSIAYVLHIDVIALLRLPLGYYSSLSTKVEFLKGLNPAEIKSCIDRSDSRRELLDCLKGLISEKLQISRSRVWDNSLQMPDNTELIILLARKSSPLNNYDKLLICKVVEQCVRLNILSHELSVGHEFFDMFLNFLILIAPIGNLDVPLPKILKLITKIFRESFNLIYTGIRFSYDHESGTATDGKLPPQYSIINYLSLNNTGIMKGNISGFTWVLGAQREHQRQTEVIFLTEHRISDKELGIFNAAISMTHMILSLFSQRLKERVQLHKLTRNFRDTLSMIKYMVDIRDSYTENHSERVAKFARVIGELMGMEEKKLERLELAGLLHDIGKIGVPEAILMKPTRLNERERRIIQLHSTLGAEILKNYSEFWDIVPWVKHHHERWDGKGYPDGLQGEEIPLEARILAVADAIEAMSSDRVYRRALTPYQIKNTLLEEAGKQWDPQIATLAAQNLKDILASCPAARTRIPSPKINRYRLESAHAWLLYLTARSMARSIRLSEEPFEMLHNALKAIAREFQYSAIYLFLIKEDCRLKELASIGKRYQLELDGFQIKKSALQELRSYISEKLSGEVAFKVINLKIYRKDIGIAVVFREERNLITVHESIVIRLPLTFLLNTYLNSVKGSP